MPIIYVSENGLEKLKSSLAKDSERLASLRAEKALAYTSAGDNWHDNPYFNKLEQDEKQLALKIADLKQTIYSARIYKSEQRNTEQVRLGSIVRFLHRNQRSGEKNMETWEIVGFGETDVAQKHVAYNSPLGTVLLGLRLGEVKEVATHEGKVEYEIVELYPNWESVPQ